MRVLLAFIATLVAVDLGLGFLAQAVWTPPLSWPNRTAQVKADLIDGFAAEEFPDVFIVGSSVSESLWPAIIEGACNTDVFQAAADGMRPEGAVAWVSNAILERGSPDTVLYALTSRAFTAAGGRDPYVWAQANRTDPLGRLDRLLTEYSAIFRYRSVLQDPRRWPPFAPPADDDRDRDGWKQPPSAGSYLTDAFAVSDRLQPPELEGASRQALVDLAELLHEAGTDLVLVHMPVTEDWERRFLGDETEARIGEQLAAFARDQEIDFISLRDLADPELMADPIHGNADGAKAFTAALTERWSGC